MFESAILDTAISLVLIYFLLSTLVTSITELWNSWRQARGRMLKFALDEVLNDRHNRNFSELLYTHPQLDLMKEHSGKLPSYLGASQFATGVMDLVGELGDEVTFEQDQATGAVREVMVPGGNNAFERLRAGMKKMKYGDLKVLLQSLVEQSSAPVDPGDLSKGFVPSPEKFRSALETWYDAYMERVSGWYKRKVRVTVFVMSIIVTVVLRVDSIELVRAVHNDPVLRAALVKVAEREVDKAEEKAMKAARANEASPTEAVPNVNQWDQLDSIRAQVDKIRALDLPIGWRWFKEEKAEVKCEKINWGSMFLGMAATAFALTFGAPFWFDVLKKLVNMRSAGKSS